MKIRTRKGFNLNSTLKKLSETRTVNHDGSTTWPNMSMDTFESYFRTALYADGISGAFIGRVVRKAMAAAQVLDEAEFIRQANKIANRMNNTERQPMKVVFPIWGSDGLLSGKCQWGGVRINFNASVKSQFMRQVQADRKKQIEDRGQGTVLEKADFSKLPLAVCTVHAIDAFDAFELAENAITIELGLHSLMESRGQNWMFFGSSDQPISNILLAPHMTAHDLSGKLANDVFWFNPWREDKREVDRDPENADKIRVAVEKYRKSIHKLPWRSMAEQALSRHYKAYSQKDLESSFLDGWRLLETIAGERYEKNDKLVKRAAWFFEDAKEKFQFGLHLMERRHLIAHGRPVRANDEEGLAFQMKIFLTPMLRSLLTNSFGFKKIEEFWAFCDLPISQDARKKQLYLLNCGAAFRREK